MTFYSFSKFKEHFFTMLYYFQKTFMFFFHQKNFNKNKRKIQNLILPYIFFCNRVLCFCLVFLHFLFCFIVEFFSAALSILYYVFFYVCYIFIYLSFQSFDLCFRAKMVSKKVNFQTHLLWKCNNFSRYFLTYIFNINTIFSIFNLGFFFKAITTYSMMICMNERLV